MSAAERIAHLSRGLSACLITSDEFAWGCVQYMSDDRECDPVQILQRLPPKHRSLVVAYTEGFAADGFYLGSPGEYFTKEALEQHIEWRRVCVPILLEYSLPQHTP